VQLQYDFAAKLAAAALIGFTGVGKAVAQHPLSALQRRRICSSMLLGAIGKHQGQFSKW